MKKINKIILVFIIFILFTIGLNLSKVKAASASLTASNSEVTVGSTVTLTGTVTAGAWNLRISGNGVNQPLVGQISSPTGNETKSVSASFTPTEPGTYTFTLTGDMTDFSQDTAENVSQSVTINVKENVQEQPTEEEPSTGENENVEETTDTNNSGSNNNSSNEQEIPEQTEYPTETRPQETQKEEKPKSSNNYLESLSVGTGTLSPEFYRETYEYNVEFGEDVNLYELANIELSAQTEDSRAKVEGTGTIDLVDGENSIKINVTAENGSVRTYTVKVIKPAKVEQSALRLTGLIINGINNEGEYQNIEFDLEPEVFEYNLTVPYAINSLSINPTTENEDIIIEVTGADSLIEGKNQVLIILTSPSDETIKTTYTFNIERQAALIQEDNARDKRQTGIVIIGGIIGAMLLLIIIVAIVKHIKKKKSLEENDEEYLEYEDGDENQDNNRNFMKYSKNDNEDDEEEDEQNYPFRGISKEKDLLERKNKNEEKEEQRMPTTDDIENPKLKWDDFVNNDDEEDKSNNIKKKSKLGKRFM